MDLNRQRLLGIVKNRALCGPRYVSLCLNNYCNDQCLYCATHSPLADNTGFKAAGMDFRLAKKLIGQAAAWGSREVLLTGLGEPTLHPDFEKIVAQVKRKKLVSTLTTNALFDKKLLPAVAAVDNVVVNLSAPEERLYARLQSPRDKTAFMKALVNIVSLVRLKKSGGSPCVTLVFILNSMNYRSVPRMLALADKLGVDKLRFRFMEHTKETRKLLLSGGQERELLAIVKREIKARRAVPNNLELMRSALLDFDGVYNISSCYAGWFVVEADFAGSARICTEKMVIGDLKKNTLKNIWQSTEAQKMRLRLKDDFKRDKPLWGPVCRLCCWLDLNLAVKSDLEQPGKRRLAQAFPGDYPARPKP